MKLKIFTLFLSIVACTTIYAQSDYCGYTMKWSFDSQTKELNIIGKGAMYDYNSNSAPWNKYKDDITSVSFVSQDVEPGVPEVPAPAAGYVTLVINIPEGSECNGIAFKGTLDNATWTGANEYLGEDGPASAAACIKFEKIADSWFKATYKLGAEPWGYNNCVLAGKLCLIYTDDSSWEGQAVNWSINDEYSTAGYGRSNDGLIEVYGSGLLYVNVGGWQMSECRHPEDYNITVIVPAFCGEEFPIEIVGSFEGWGSEPVALSKVEGNKFKATIMANANAQWKVRGQGSWDKEIQIYRAEDDPATEGFDETDTWGGVPNNVLTDEKNVTVDYSDPAKYRWNVCEGANYIVGKKRIALPQHLLASDTPIGITYIGRYAFYDCKNVTSIEIPSSVTSIGEGAFYNISNIVYNGTATGSPWGAKSVNGFIDGWFVYSDNTKTTLQACFANAIGDVVIPNSVTSIGKSAFSGCSGLTSVTIPTNVTRIEGGTFYNCRNLKEVILGSSVKLMEIEALYECPSIKSITCYSMRPPTVTSYGYTNIPYSTIVYVPADYMTYYLMHDFWGLYDVRPIGAATTTVDEVKVEPEETSADIAWPAVEGAYTYELVIRDKSGNLICTLIFNAQGQLTSIAFHAPSRDGAPQHTQAAGFSFTVTGLDSGTGYDLTMTSKNATGQVIEEKTVSFTTEGDSPTGVENVQSDNVQSTKVLRNGQIFILRGDKIYTLQGQEVK